MERNIFEKQRELNDRLNRYRDEYYNRNAPSVSDEVYDRLFLSFFCDYCTLKSTHFITLLFFNLL